MTAIGHTGHAPSATTGVGGDPPPGQRIEFPVVGLTCGACVQAVEHAIRAVPGVSGATVNLTRGRAFVEYAPAQTTVAALHEAIKAAGYRSETATARFRIEGITCASCVTQIEAALRETPGVLAATVSLGSEEAVVEYAPGATDLPAVKAAVASAGYEVAETPPPAALAPLDREAKAREHEYRTLMRQWWFGAARRRLHHDHELSVALPGPGRLCSRGTATGSGTCGPAWAWPRWRSCLSAGATSSPGPGRRSSTARRTCTR